MAFFTKKQKRLMRERKKKKKLADEGEVKNSSPAGKKRPRTTDPVPQQTVEELVALTAVKQNHVVVVPKSLSAKDQKKFRKDARRQARAEGRDESKLRFVLQGSKDLEPKKKKPRKEFPRINELVKQEKAEKQVEKEKQALKDADAKLPQEYKSKYVAMVSARRQVKARQTSDEEYTDESWFFNRIVRWLGLELMENSQLLRVFRLPTGTAMLYLTDL